MLHFTTIISFVYALYIRKRYGLSYLITLLASIELVSLVAFFFSFAIGGQTFHKRIVSSADALAIVEASGLFTANRILQFKVLYSYV